MQAARDMQEGSKAVAKSYGKCREFVTILILGFERSAIEDEVTAGGHPT